MFMIMSEVAGSGETTPGETVSGSQIIGADTNGGLWEALGRHRIQHELAVQALTAVAPEDALDPLEYARHRREQEPWVTVEIGPGGHPSGLLRRNYRGKSAYIGIENNSFTTFSKFAGPIFGALREERPKDHIFLREDPTFGRSEDGSTNYYDFPDEIADEIYLAQVYDKPNSESCEHNGDQADMTKEVARLLRPGGKALIFDYQQNLVDIMGWLDEAGLKVRFVARDTVVDTETAETISVEGFFHTKMELESLEGDLIIIAEKPAAQAPASPQTPAAY
jgi:SAM-dependent methyltransferase